MSQAARSPTSTAKNERGIGVFDSGVGGLTVLGALMAKLPGERFVYLGDTARVPYGSKPLAMVRGFAQEIVAELLDRDVKAIVIACNSASAASLPALAESCPVPVWGVIEPGVAAAMAALDEPGTVGVLGTEATIEARVYQDRLEAAGAATWARACPLFVPLVEEGLQDSEIAKLVVDHYLGDRPRLAAVILGCTHYPLLKPALRLALADRSGGAAFHGRSEPVVMIDSSEAVAEHVARELERLDLLAGSGSAPATAPAPPAGASADSSFSERLQYLVTGDVDVFLHSARRLGGVTAAAEHVVLRPAGRPRQPTSRSSMPALTAPVEAA